MTEPFEFIPNNPFDQIKNGIDGNRKQGFAGDFVNFNSQLTKEIKENGCLSRR
jgi:hypothetical protein